MKPHKYLIIIALLLFTRNCPAQNTSSKNLDTLQSSNYDSTEIQKQTVQSINQRFGPDIKRLDVKPNGVINSLISKGLNKRLTETDPEKRVLQFLEMNKDILHIENVKEQITILKNDQKLTDRLNIAVPQVENNIHVIDGVFFFSLSKNPSGVTLIDGLSGRFCPEARGICTIPAINAQAAEQVALTDTICIGQNPTLDGSPLLRIKLYKDQAKLVWFVSLKNIYSCKSGTYDFYIDAQDGTVLGTRCFEMP